MLTDNNLSEIIARLKKIPTSWDGKGSISEMQVRDYPHWRQMEWIGWYFQYLCSILLKDIMQIPGPKFGRVEFDAMLDNTAASPNV